MAVSVENLVNAYRAIRDKKSELAKEYESKEQALLEELDVIKRELLNVCKMIDADSIKTKAGTVMRGIRSRYQVTDWEPIYQLIEETKSYDLLEKRINQTNMKAFIEENPDKVPQGLNSVSEYTITVRRS
jgi:hypothetical protein